MRIRANDLKLGARHEPVRRFTRSVETPESPKNDRSHRANLGARVRDPVVLTKYEGIPCLAGVGCKIIGNGEAGGDRDEGEGRCFAFGIQAIDGEVSI